MSDSGAGPDLVVAAMFLIAAVLAATAFLPSRRLGNRVGPSGAGIVASGLAGAVALATMQAGVYADGSSHWQHMSHAIVLTGGAIAVAAAAILFGAGRPRVLRAGLVAGSAGTLMLALSSFTYQTPG